MILIYRHSTLQFISWKWKYLCLILRRERACLSLQRTRKGHHFQGYYHLISNSVSGLFIGKFGRYRILQRGAVKIFGTLLPRPRTCEAKIIFTFPILILEKKNQWKEGCPKTCFSSRTSAESWYYTCSTYSYACMHIYVL